MYALVANQFPHLNVREHTFDYNWPYTILCQARTEQVRDIK